MKFKVTYFENLKYTFSSSHQQKVHQIFDLCNDSINVDGRFSFLFVQGKKSLISNHKNVLACAFEFRRSNSLYGTINVKITKKIAMYEKCKTY